MLRLPIGLFVSEEKVIKNEQNSVVIHPDIEKKLKFEII